MYFYFNCRCIRYIRYDLLLHTIGQTWEHCVSSRDDNVGKHGSTEEYVIPLDGVVDGFMDTAEVFWKRASGHSKHSLPILMFPPFLGDIRVTEAGHQLTLLRVLVRYISCSLISFINENFEEFLASTNNVPVRYLQCV